MEGLKLLWYRPRMLEALTANDFKPHVGEAYRLVPTEGEPVEAVLATVMDYERGLPEGRSPFTVTFRAPPGTALPQGMFRVEHERAEPLDLFIVPIGPDADAAGMLYEAVFA